MDDHRGHGAPRRQRRGSGGYARPARAQQAACRRVPVLELTPSHRAGTGTPLLLLHGIGAIWRAWSPVLPYLEPHHEVIVPTLHGHAGGPPLDSGVAPSVQALVDGIEEELDRLGLPKVHIAGNSLGGWIGIELARRGRAQSLVLLSPAGAWRSPRRLRLTAHGIRFSVGALARNSSRAEAIAERRLLHWAMLAGQVAHPHRVPRETLVTYIHASGQSPVVEPLLRVLHSPTPRSTPAARRPGLPRAAGMGRARSHPAVQAFRFTDARTFTGRRVDPPQRRGTCSDVRRARPCRRADPRSNPCR